MDSYILGVFDKYMIQVQGQRKFTTDKLLITEEKGCIFVEYTIVVVIHIIYTPLWGCHISTL